MFRFLLLHKVRQLRYCHTHLQYRSNSHIFLLFLWLTDILTDPRYRDCKPRTRDNTHTSIVIYLVNPFLTGSSASASSSSNRESSDAQEEYTSILALMMCYQELLDSLPAWLKQQTYLEIVPLQSVLSANSQAPDRQVRSGQSLSLNVFWLSQGTFHWVCCVDKLKNTHKCKTSTAIRML